MKDKTKTATATLVKLWEFETGEIREKPIYSGTLRGCKKRIPPSKKDQFRIDFKGAKK